VAAFFDARDMTSTATATATVALVIAALSAGCATDSQTAPSNELRATPEYRTGSNIPVREPRSTNNTEKKRSATPGDAARPADPAAKPTN
jgi:hypothetical protein